jgi:hypothetical protein
MNDNFFNPISKETKEKGFFSLGGMEKDIKRQEELKNINLKDLEKEIEELEKRLDHE